MPAKRLRWTSSARIALFAAIAGWPMATACSGSSGGTPAGSGDDFTNDTRDSSVRATPNPDPGDDAGPDAMNTGPTYYGEGGTYPGLAQCGNCTCGAPANYCFGGATARTTSLMPFAIDAGKSGADSGGLPACAIVDASAPELGCNAMPAGCADCACVLSKLQPSYSCYLVCASDGPGTPMTVYCPHM